MSGVEYTLPQADYRFYGREIGEYDEGEGFVVAGHDRRSWAALNRHARETDGIHGRPYRVDPDKVKRDWVTFAETCGCTPEQHAKHESPIPDDADEHDPDNEYGECYDHCEDTRYGLPPCGDTYAWMVTEYAKADTPGAVPILTLWW